MGFERGEGSGSHRLVFKSISDILKNTPSLSYKSSDFHPQSHQDELRNIHAMKLMEKLKEAELKEAKLKFEGRMMEELIPPKSSYNTETVGRPKASSIDLTEKKDWMSRVNLWSIPIEYGDHYVTPNQYQQEQGSGLFNGGSAGAFAPFKKQPGVTIKDCNVESDDVTQVEQADHVVLRTVNEGKRGAAIPRPPKRQRRCWTPELHGLFVDALNTIGGAEAATPKHILEHMQVEGLTADEVKSHLQKFRIHIRKLAAEFTEKHMDGIEENQGDEVYED